MIAESKIRNVRLYLSFLAKKRLKNSDVFCEKISRADALSRQLSCKPGWHLVHRTSEFDPLFLGKNKKQAIDEINALADEADEFLKVLVEAAFGWK